METSREQRAKNIEAIAFNILNTFNEDNELGKYIDLDKVDGTELITDMVKAMNVVFQELTGEEEGNIDFTYLCNRLIVQEALETASKERGSRNAKN